MNSSEAEAKFKIYTKTGDKGTSSLYTGERRDKDNMIFESLGAIDELNAHLGLASEHCQQIDGLDKKVFEQLVEIQARLMDVGSHIATPRQTEKIGAQKKISHTEFEEANVTALESWIDDLDASLPPLTNFILPSGGLASSQIHVARTVCRRAERGLVPLLQSGSIDQVVFTYVNRLSDYLFTLARFCAKAAGKEETIYQKAKKKEE